MPNKRYVKTLKKMREVSKEKTEAQDLKEYTRILGSEEVKNLQGYTVLDGISDNYFIIANEDSILPSTKMLKHELGHTYKEDLLQFQGAYV